MRTRLVPHGRVGSDVRSGERGQSARRIGLSVLLATAVLAACASEGVAPDPELDAVSLRPVDSFLFVAESVQLRA